MTQKITPLNQQFAKVTVIGGSGFLGSHVADQLSIAGHQVTIFDRTLSPWLRDDQSMVIGELLDNDKLNEAIAGADAVYNFAAIADLNEALKKPVDAVRVNILGNTLALEMCKTHNVKRFVYASTVYVNSREGGFYRCSKQASEGFVEEYQRVYGLDYTILRYGSLYGPRSNENNGLYRIVRNALENKEVHYEGHPESRREYVHVEDAARASVDVLNPEFCNESIVLTGQESMRVYDMLHMLAEILGIHDAVRFVESEYEGHYVRTPYAYQPKLGRKFIPPVHVDLGQGLLQLIEEISTSRGES